MLEIGNFSLIYNGSAHQPISAITQVAGMDVVIALLIMLTICLLFLTVGIWLYLWTIYVKNM
jgi:hypothetical protein